VPTTRTAETENSVDTTDSSLASTERPKTGEKTRVQVTGRIAHPPRFEITRKNRIHTLRFSVAEHPDMDTTVYHQVLAFNELADRWNGALEKGEQVRVIGYRHVRQGKARDGSPKEFPELYATAISKRA
jgi:single-stranded DNA-binding protein